MLLFLQHSKIEIIYPPHLKKKIEKSPWDMNTAVPNLFAFTSQHYY